MSTDSSQDWKAISERQFCPYLNKKCKKNRKSEPKKTIGSCTVRHSGNEVIICPHRLSQNGNIFRDCIHLLTKHEPGNTFHCVPELSMPGGTIDYFLASVKTDKIGNERVVDFVGIELQTLDSTGTIYPDRQQFLMENGVTSKKQNDTSSENKPFGMNWKMTAKTILIQLHHKIATFQALNKHLVLVTQDCLIEYMSREFSFEHMEEPSLGNPMHFHPYSINQNAQTKAWTLQLGDRLSTDSVGIARCLDLNTESNVNLEHICKLIEGKLSPNTILSI